MKIDNFYEKIYVVHWKLLKERRSYLEEQFKKFNLTERVVWVDQYADENELKFFKNPFKINLRLLAVNLSHLYCYEDQYKNKYKNILIFEDDIDFGSLNIPVYLNQAAKEFKELDGDLAFLSTCCGLKVKNFKPPQLLYYDKNYVTRCTAAYIVNLRCVEKLIVSMTNFHAIDRILNYMIPHMNIRVLWSAIPLKQGSETGKYPSSMVELRNSDGNYKS